MNLPVGLLVLRLLAKRCIRLMVIPLGDTHLGLHFESLHRLQIQSLVAVTVLEGLAQIVVAGDVVPYLVEEPE